MKLDKSQELKSNYFNNIDSYIQEQVRELFKSPKIITPSIQSSQ